MEEKDRHPEREGRAVCVVDGKKKKIAFDMFLEFFIMGPIKKLNYKNLS